MPVSFFYEGLGQGDSGQTGDVRDLMQRKETIELVRALNALDERHRRQIVKLVMALSGEAEPSVKEAPGRIGAPSRD